jgi:polysaccharide pyruvyl transferase WcaK-like protein
MTPPRRLLFIGDVGGETARHVGDEAMLEANLAGFRALFPSVESTVVSRDPDWIRSRYGIESVPLFGFPRGRDASSEREKLLSRLRVEAVSSGSTCATLDALRRADAVVISGGGNLSSSWPDLLFERIALLSLASLLGKPAIVVGQTLGPRLEPGEARLLGESLRLARMVGVRERPSLALAVSIGVPLDRLWYQADDAIFLGETVADGTVRLRGPSSSIAITIDPQVRAWGRGLFAAIAKQLRELAESTGATPVLLPHMFGDERAGLPSDLTEARLLAAAIGLERTTIVEGSGAETAAEIARHAELVVSSRYHPLVFAMSAGTPAIGIYPDEYCRIKLEGALAHAEAESWALPYEVAGRGGLRALARELWDDRVTLRRRLTSFQAGWRAESRSRWSAIESILVGAMIAEQGDDTAGSGKLDTERVRGLPGTLRFHPLEQRRRDEALRHAQALELQRRSELSGAQTLEPERFSARLRELHRHTIDTMARRCFAARAIATKFVRRILG